MRIVIQSEAQSAESKDLRFDRSAIVASSAADST